MRKNVIHFAEKEIAPYINKMEQGAFPRDLLRKMGDLGLMGLCS